MVRLATLTRDLKNINLKLLKSTTKTQHKVKNRLFLNIVVSKTLSPPTTSQQRSTMTNLKIDENNTCD